MVSIVGGRAVEPAARGEDVVPQRLGGRMARIAGVVCVERTVRDLEEAQPVLARQLGQELGVDGVVEVGVVELRDAARPRRGRDRQSVGRPSIARGLEPPGIEPGHHGPIEQEPVHVEQALLSGRGRRDTVAQVLGQLDAREHERPGRAKRRSDPVVIGEDHEIEVMLAIPAHHLVGGVWLSPERDECRWS